MHSDQVARAEAASVLQSLQAIQNVDILLRSVMSGEEDETAEERGCSRTRINQIVREVRAKLVARK